MEQACSHWRTEFSWALWRSTSTIVIWPTMPRSERGMCKGTSGRNRMQPQAAYSAHTGSHNQPDVSRLDNSGFGIECGNNQSSKTRTDWVVDQSTVGLLHQYYSNLTTIRVTVSASIRLFWALFDEETCKWHVINSPKRPLSCMRVCNVWTYVCSVRRTLRICLE